MEFEQIIPAVEFTIKHKDESFDLADFAKELIYQSESTNLSQATQQLAKKHKIIESSNSLSFVKNEYKLFFYVLAYTRDSIREFSESEVIKFLKDLDDKKYHKSVASSWFTLNAYVLLILNRVYNIDIARLLSEKKIGRKVFHYYWDLLPYLAADPIQLVNALFMSTEGIKAEGNYVTLNRSVQITATQNLDFGKALLTSCKVDFQKMELFFPHAFMGLSRSIGLKALSLELQELLNSSTRNIKILGLRTFAWLHGYNDRPQDIMQDIEPILETTEAMNDDQLTGQLIYVYGLLLDKLPNAREKLLSIPKKQNGPDTYFALSHIVMLKIDEERNNDWFKQALPLLTNLKGHHLGTYNNLSSTFAYSKGDNTQLFIAFIDQFISNPNNPISNIEGFKLAIESFIENDKPAFEAWLTEAFNNDNRRFHLAASRILMNIDKKDNVEIRLSEEILNRLRVVDIEFLLYKIVGNVVSKEHLQSLTFSALRYNDSTGFIAQMVKELFCFYIMYNYPASIEFLRNQLEGANDIERVVIEESQQYYNDEHRIKSKKPLELAPSPKRMQEYFNAYSKKFQNTENLSPFRQPSILDFVTKITMKMGNAFFHRDDDYADIKNKYKNKSQMGKVGIEFDLPGGEFVDPVGQEYNRYCWRIAKRRTA